MEFQKLLKEKSVRQNQLAAKLNITPQLVTNWVKGRSQPQLELVKKIADVLNVSADKILECFTKSGG